MSVWIHITSGQGPTECQWAVARIAELIAEEATAEGVACQILETTCGVEADTAKSALLAVEIEADSTWIQSWVGTVQWIGQSPFRPTHRRKNWFVGVALLTPPDESGWSPDEVKIETFRASGPGGQHVNKTSSAVRLTHIPTGAVVIAQEERSQYRNRRLALARLAEVLDHAKKEKQASAQHDRWRTHASIQRGDPVRVYRGPAMARVR
jgi:peptide chain release factor